MPRVALTLLAMLALLTGCGGGGSKMTTTTGADAGTVMIGLTDAPGDFVHYTVDVVSLSLQKTDGTTVETLPATGRLDFADYQDLTELFTAAQVPSGTYVSGSITLDYGNADLVVDTGNGTMPATAVDQDGQPLGRYTLQVQLANGHPLVVRRGLPSLLNIDFDLDASSIVDMSHDPALVTTAPFLLAQLQPVAEKTMRVRGPLLGVDQSGSQYSVQLRPWQLPAGPSFGTASVHTAGTTQFEINGTGYTGQAGLAALAGLPAATPTVAQGTLTTSDWRFDATLVLAGSSVPGADMDTVRGTVVRRTGDELTVRGATVIRPQGVVIYHDKVTVQVGNDTIVKRRPKLDPGEPALDPSAISVGQRVVIAGKLSDTDPTVLDATTGRAWLLVTHASGVVNSTGPGQLELGLTSIDRRNVSLFDFTGTGTAPGMDADPAHYAVATGSLPLDGISAGDPVRVLGYVQPFGAAPPDFNAETVVALSMDHARLAIGWRPDGSSAPFSMINADGIVPDLTSPQLGAVHAIRIGGVPIDLLSLPAAPTLAPPATGPTCYAILADHRVVVYPDFASFVQALNDQLDGHRVVYGLWASGSWNRSQATFTARTLAVRLSAG